MKTFTNSFHKTSIKAKIDASLDFTDVQANAQSERTPGKWTRLEKRIRKALCGMKDCTCGVVRA